MNQNKFIISIVVTTAISFSVLSYTNPIKQNISALECSDRNCELFKAFCSSLHPLPHPFPSLNNMTDTKPNFSVASTYEPKCAIFIDGNKNSSSNNNNSKITLKYLSTNSDLNITSTDGFPNGNYYNLIGEVSNNGLTVAKLVEIIATFYDEN